MESYHCQTFSANSATSVMVIDKTASESTDSVSFMVELRKFLKFYSSVLHLTASLFEANITPHPLYCVGQVLLPLPQLTSNLAKSSWSRSRAFKQSLTELFPHLNLSNSLEACHHTWKYWEVTFSSTGEDSSTQMPSWMAIWAPTSAWNLSSWATPEWTIIHPFLRQLVPEPTSPILTTVGYSQPQAQGSGSLHTRKVTFNVPRASLGMLEPEHQGLPYQLSKLT